MFPQVWVFFRFLAKLKSFLRIYRFVPVTGANSAVFIHRICVTIDSTPKIQIKPL